MRKEKNRVAVIGSGIMGLTVAYELLKKGYKVTVFEKEDRVGGMSASFNFNGIILERYYHFICKPDIELMKLLNELKILNIIKWEKTKMGFFYNGKLFSWRDPFSLLKFPSLNIIEKINYGLHILKASKKKRWKDIDKIKAVDWVKRNVGENGYNVLWKNLFNLKFHQYGNTISAAWLWSRIKRVASSRKNIFSEELGYYENGTKQLFDVLLNEIQKMNGVVLLNCKIEKITIKNNRVTGINYKNKNIEYDIVVSTIPLPYISKLVPDMNTELKTQYNNIKNIGIVCPVIKLKKKISENFWMNINDSRIASPGIIELSNLKPLKNNIVYIPLYLPENHDKYFEDDDTYFEESLKILKIINNEFNDKWVLDFVVNRNRYAQPIFTQNFLVNLPPIKTQYNGLFISDTSYYYPEDRSISESIKMGKQIAKMI